MDSEALRRMRVDGLKALLRERGLPVGGKKQDLIDRLQRSQRASGGLSMASIPAMKVPELKSHLRSRGLPVGGSKQQLVERLTVFESHAAKALPSKSAAVGFSTSAVKKSTCAVKKPTAKKPTAKKAVRAERRVERPGKPMNSKKTGKLVKKSFPLIPPSTGSLKLGDVSVGLGGTAFGVTPLFAPAELNASTTAQSLDAGGLRLGFCMGRGDAVYVSVDPRARKSPRLAAFDLDSTLTRPVTGGPFPCDGNDWQWFTPSVPAKLQELASEGYRIVVFSNQRGVAAGHTTLEDLEQRIEAMRARAGVPICFLFALDTTNAKPNTSLFDYFHENMNEGCTNRSLSFYVGDMDGSFGSRDTDKRFALSVGLPFRTTSEVFTGACANSTASFGSKSCFGKTGTSAAQKFGVAAAKQYQIPHSAGHTFSSSAADFALPSEPKVAPSKAPVRPLAQVFECDNVQQFNISTSLAVAAEGSSLTDSAPAVIGNAWDSLEFSSAAPLRRSEGSGELGAKEIYWGCCEQLVKEGREEELSILIEQAHSVLGGGHSEYAVTIVCDALCFLKPPPLSLVSPLVTLIKEDGRQTCRVAALRALVDLIGRFSKNKNTDAMAKNEVFLDDVLFQCLIKKVANVGNQGAALLGILDGEEACLALRVLRFWCNASISPEQKISIMQFLTDPRLLSTPKLNELLLALGPVLALRAQEDANNVSVSNNANLMEKFSSLLVHENPEVERLAFRFFSNVTSGNESQTQQAIEVGIIREAVRCIRTHSCSSPSQALVVDEAWFCLSNVAAGTGPQVARLAEFAEDLLPLMIQQLENDACCPVVRMDLLQTLSNLFAHRRMSGPGSSLDIHRLFATPALLRAAAPLPLKERSFASLLDNDVLKEAIGTDSVLESAYGSLLAEA